LKKKQIRSKRKLILEDARNLTLRILKGCTTFHKKEVKQSLIKQKINRRFVGTKGSGTKDKLQRKGSGIQKVVVLTDRTPFINKTKGSGIQKVVASQGHLSSTRTLGLQVSAPQEQHQTAPCTTGRPQVFQHHSRCFSTTEHHEHRKCFITTEHHQTAHHAEHHCSYLKFFK
jgi:hypothetical protein